jgi:NAD(P)-dependent dehydrogenase (short-subunit alcohol dehydrogenase family)
MSSRTQTVIVTGGFGVLGRAVAERFAAGGWNVAALDRVDTRVAGKSNKWLELGGVDLTRQPSADRAFATVVETFGGLDALVNVAGGFKWQPLDGGELDTWDLLFALNLKTAVVATRAALPHLKASGAGRIVNIGAGAAAARAGTGMAAYTASKAGVHKLTESLADELKDLRITVNAVCPGVTKTEILEKVPEEYQQMLTARVPMGRMGTPQEVASLTLFLASDEASYITGAAYIIDGGRGAS